ncbi:FK506 binding protein proline rotamase rapamycin-binding protein [Chytridiales sp. JEL 0842]|nr:FK506 binding protein proline rotamase rapamycin-binding protein [Chytridiales sp. JEL 0842]
MPLPLLYSPITQQAFLRSAARSSPLSSSLRPQANLPIIISSPHRLFHASAISKGVTKDIIKAGDGVNFPKKLAKNGNKFDSSVDRGKPFVCKIGVGQVIRGWDEGVPQMSLGEKAVLRITYDYAYGNSGFPPVIPPQSDLNFEVELLKIN